MEPGFISGGEGGLQFWEDGGIVGVAGGEGGTEGAGCGCTLTDCHASCKPDPRTFCFRQLKESTDVYPF